MERLPKITYAVGQKATCCPKEAGKLAKDSGGHIHYCVAGKEFDCEAEAQTALVEATEKFVAAFADPHKCPKSGQVTLAGQPQSCPKTAARTAKRMKEAMAKVNFTYLVGDKQSCCPKEAAKVAKETGEQKVFVVGEEKTCCEKTARLSLARAKYKAAVTAMVQAANEKSGS
jgi:4-hydroxy-3-methylbut-2-enyl diphosphate reductase IspH